MSLPGYELDKYQQDCERTMAPYGDEMQLLYTALGLAGETGEYVDGIKKILYHGHHPEGFDVVSELGDILWYVAAACRAHGLSLSYVASKNVDKLRERYPDGFSKERSRNRKEMTPGEYAKIPADQKGWS